MGGDGIETSLDVPDSRNSSRLDLRSNAVVHHSVSFQE